LSTVDDNPMVPIGATVSALVIVVRHRANLSRLFAGTERRVGQRLGDPSAGSELSH